MTEFSEKLITDEGTLIKGKAEAGERLDVFTAALTGETRSFCKRIIDMGEVTVNGRECRAGYKLRAGDEVEAFLSAPKNTELVPEDIPLDIVYQDSDIAVINKPRGMVVHPAPGNESGTLVNAVMFHIKDLSGIGGELRPGIVHRIDKLTSGLIVIAKNDDAHRLLSAELKEHTAGRVYAAIVDGNIKEDGGRIDAPIGRHPADRKRMAVTDGGREAATNFFVLARTGKYTLIAAMLETGRTHQIRVHMAHIKHPVAGDAVYGDAKDPLGIGGQALHAARLVLDMPSDGARRMFSSALPEYFTKAMRRAGFDDVADLDLRLDEIARMKG